MEARKAIIHIGPVKTGSKTIQMFLLRNHDALKSRGILVPLFGSTGGCGNVFALPLSVLANHEELPPTTFKYDWRHLSRKSLSQMSRKDSRKQLDHHLSTPLPMTILTSECFCELSQDNIGHMKEYLDSHFQEYTIIAYLRRQPELLVSWYSQLMNAGSLPFDASFDEYVSSYFYDESRNFDNYWNMLERWKNVFGRESIKPRIFDRKDMIQNDLLTDFSSVAEIDMNGLVRVEPQQVSSDSETTEFMRLLGLHFPMRGDQSLPSRYHLSGMVQRLFSQSGSVGYRLNRSQSQAILDKYRESNNAVAGEYFGRESLFSDDVSAYPEETLPHHLNLEKAAQISATIIEELYGEIEKQHQELAFFKSMKNPDAPPPHGNEKKSIFKKILRETIRPLKQGYAFFKKILREMTRPLKQGYAWCCHCIHRRFMSDVEKINRALLEHCGMWNDFIIEQCSESPDGNWWNHRHEKCREQMQKGNIDVLMIGDSITHNWELFGIQAWKRYYSHRKTLNLGFSADTVEKVLWRLEHLPLDKINPKLTVIQIGTNNITLKQGTPEEISEKILEVVGLLSDAFPEMTILVIGVFPFHDTLPNSEEYRMSISEVNSRLQRLLANRDKVFMLDIGKVFLTRKGAISRMLMPDGAHPNEKGYWLWAKKIEPTIKKVLKQYHRK